jgi:hypothetical protein
MKRFMICFALVGLMAFPLAANAGAKAKSSGVQAQVAAGSVGVTLAGPAGRVDNPNLLFSASVVGDDTAAVCITNFLANLPLPCNLVSYVTFSVDGQVLGRDDLAPYSLGLSYGGPSGRHTAAVDVWRDINGDAQAVSLGHAESAFCLNNCGS